LSDADYFKMRFVCKEWNQLVSTPKIEEFQGYIQTVMDGKRFWDDSFISSAINKLARTFSQKSRKMERIKKKETAIALFSLGDMYYAGLRKTPLYKKAFICYQQALTLGYAPPKEYVNAQFNLGEMYRHGKGSNRNYNEALKCYRLAAEQGHARA